MNGNPRSLLCGTLESPTGHQSDYVYTEHHALQSHRTSTPNPTSSHSYVTGGRSLNLSGFQVTVLQGRWWDKLGGLTVTDSASCICKEWALQVDPTGGHCRWTLQVGPASGLCRWALQVDLTGGHCRWTLQVSTASGPQAGSLDSPTASKALSSPLPSLQHKSVGTS